MKKKTIFLELPAEMVEEIDRRNVIGYRSAFITDIINRQLHGDISVMNTFTELTSMMKQEITPGEISLIDNRGKR